MSEQLHEDNTGLVPVTIYLPENFVEKIESRQGALSDLAQMAVERVLKDGLDGVNAHNIAESPKAGKDQEEERDLSGVYALLSVVPRDLARHQ